jgi:gamma-glutamyl hercynylcysteine S-oxide synthase
MPSQTAASADVTGAMLEALAETRRRMLALVAHLDDAALERVHSPLMSPLVWDLGHIAAFEDLWLAHRLGGEPLLRPDLADVYDAFETPRAQRGDLPYLRRAEASAYLDAVRERTLAVAAHADGEQAATLFELVLRHEQQHTETMLQTMALARLPSPSAHAPLSGAGDEVGAQALSGLELTEVPAGPCTLGAPTQGFAYDNERPRHAIELPAFRIGVAPVTNGAYRAFVERGGYERREWWTREAWAWKEEYDIERPAGWTADGREWRMDRCEPLDPRKPVVHVSWFEADAFARAHGARLPTEAEWEKAATWDQATGTARTQPWGEQPQGDAIAARANVDQGAFGTLPVGTFAADASPAGCRGMVGDTWEWTASRFDGYPGFAAHPYREYSEVFFGGDYRVLRGGSWATRARVATPTFRNWDHPQRRQIFAGLRIAKDA